MFRRIFIRSFLVSLVGVPYGAMGAAGCGSSSSSTPSGSSLSSSGSTAQGLATGDAASSASGADAGAVPVTDGSTAAAVVGDAATLLPCLAVTCILPNEVCCPGFELDGGADCSDAGTCNAAGADIYECVGPKNCESGQVCCLNYGAADGGGDLAFCEDADTCAAGFGADPGTDQVCLVDGDCASLGESCQMVSGAALTICN
ncbi:MAG TPA: hypothetical protein VEK07_05690 [Polyangiaceae bacterium]|nr:hypothetical protein [Polyangiaceae bacterium]